MECFFSKIGKYGPPNGLAFKSNITVTKRSVTFVKQTRILHYFNAHTTHPFYVVLIVVLHPFHGVLHTIQTLLCSTTKQTTQQRSGTESVLQNEHYYLLVSVEQNKRTQLNYFQS